MIDIQKLELFPKEIYANEQFLTYEYYYETVKLWEDLIHYAEGLLDRYSSNLVANHRSQHLSHQADYVWGTIVLPNFKGTLDHLQSGLEDLKAGFLPILRRMSSINNDVIAQGRDYPCDWMDTVEKGAVLRYKAKERIISIRATNIYVVNNYHNIQWDYKDLLSEELLIGIDFPNPLPVYRLNSAVMVKTGEPILKTGIYRSIEPYSASRFLMHEKKMGAEHDEDWRLAPEVSAFKDNPNNYTDETYEYPRDIPTTWILVERVAEGNDVDLTPTQEKLSQKGGEPCPKTGYWTTPAQPGTRRYFTQGDVLPTLPHTDWGTVYWYFSGEE